MSLADFILVSLGVWALWSIASGVETISDELTDIRRILDEELHIKIRKGD
jgi:hypothetical protein